MERSFEDAWKGASRMHEREVQRCPMWCTEVCEGVSCGVQNEGEGHVGYLGRVVLERAWGIVEKPLLASGAQHRVLGVGTMGAYKEHISMEGI